MKSRSCAAIVCLFAFSMLLVSVDAADWNQWRGPNRDGSVVDSPALLSSLPDGGIKPLWAVPKLGRGGGWSSPAIANGKVYLYANPRQKTRDAVIPESKFPRLTEEQQAKMSQDELTEYDKKRREETAANRRKFYEFFEHLYCLDANTGKELWRNEHKTVATKRPQSGSPAVVGGRVYFLGTGRKARCIDAVTGKDIWETPLPIESNEQQVPSSVAIADGVAIFLAGRLFGVDAKNGKLLWDAEDTSGHHSSPVVWNHEDRELAIANLNRSDTICIEPRNGEELWRVRGDAPRSTPLVVGDRLITYGSSRGKGLRCYKMSLESAELLWNFRGIADQGSSPVVVDDHVYVQGDIRLACIDLETGDPKWRTNLDVAKPRYTSLIAADNKIFYAFGGVLCFEATPDEFRPLIDAKIDNSGLLATTAYFRDKLNIEELESTADGQAEAEKLWKRSFGRSGPMSCTTPAIADGRIYLRTRSGVVCYDLNASASR